jgi:glycosyltransferase involved in cell wall biosynthesis
MVTMSRPDLTIGIPVYNGERYLRECLEGIAAQTFGDFRAIIGDNCSNDGTEEIARSFIAQDPRFEYVRHAVNMGGARNSNFLLDRCESTWFKWAYHDDLCDTDLFASSMQILARSDDTVLAYPQVRLIDGDGAVVGRHDDGALNLADDRVEVRVANLLRRVVTQVQFGIMRTDVARDSGGTSLSVAGEMVLPLGMALRGRLDVVPGSYVYIRQHEERHGGHRRSEMAWVAPDQRGTPFPYSRSSFVMLAAVRSAPLTAVQRRRCIGALIRHWTIPQWRLVAGDLVRLPYDAGLVGGKS